MRKFSSEANLVADVAAVFHYDDDLCKKRSSHSPAGDNARHIATLRNISNAMYILEVCVISRCLQVTGSMKSEWFRTQQRGVLDSGALHLGEETRFDAHQIIANSNSESSQGFVQSLPHRSTLDVNARR